VALAWLCSPLAIAYVSMRRRSTSSSFVSVSLLQSLSIPLYVVGRSSQIYSSYLSESTGNLSVVSFAAAFVGSAIRIFTTMKQLNGDAVALTGFVISCICNAIIIAQIIVYSHRNRNGNKRKGKSL